mmetsp:Transcript_24095/g.36460  ORF Transcript_24095/g.36460 Transcript_24095/m.36460 type:complete len:93 (-) Transcript_24095:13-291(-)
MSVPSMRWEGVVISQKESKQTGRRRSRRRRRRRLKKNEEEEAEGGGEVRGKEDQSKESMALQRVNTHHRGQKNAEHSKNFDGGPTSKWQCCW